MAGVILRVLPRTDYSLTNLTANVSTTTTVARKIDVSRFREIVVLSRLHSTTSWANVAQVQVLAAPDGFTDEDPNQIWNAPASVQLALFKEGTDALPSFKVASIPAPWTGLIMLQLTFTQGTAGGVAFTPVVSIDLNGRE